MPQQHMVIPHYLGKDKELKIENEKVVNHIRRRDDSFSSSPSQNIPLLLPQESHGLYVSKGRLESNGLGTSSNLNHPIKMGAGLPPRHQKAKIQPVVSERPMKGFLDEIDCNNESGKMSQDRVACVSTKGSVSEWLEAQEWGDQGGFVDGSGEVGPRSSCRCQVCY